jgi:hypothetical protein
LKSLNVLLDAECRIRICDFGFSRYSTDVPMTQNLGTAHWMAPELLCECPTYTSKVDVYAYGIVLWELATGMPPYIGQKGKAVTVRVKEEDIRPVLPPDLNPATRDLITQCWDRDPDNRPTFDDIVSRWETGQILLPEANRHTFLRYVRESGCRGEMLVRDIQMLFKKVVAGDVSLREATQRLVTTGIPSEIVNQCWSSVSGILHKFPLEDIADYLLLYRKTPRVKDAMQALREMPINQVPVAVINRLINAIPTGSDAVDMDIVVTVCRNGCAELCIVSARNSMHIQLALEVVSHNGVDPQMKAAVVDKCVQLIGSHEVDLVGSALKCLLSMNQLTRVGFGRLESLLYSENATASNSAFLAIASLAHDGEYPPQELFARLVEIAEEDFRADLPMTMCCRNCELAGSLLRNMEQELPGMIREGMVRAVCCAARHRELAGRIAALVTDPHFVERAPKYQSIIEGLMQRLEASRLGT